MDMPPPQEIYSQQVTIINDSQIPHDDIKYHDPYETYNMLFLSRIDGPDIPENVKIFAKENNCTEIIKFYYWSHKIFNNNGGVYSCIKNKKEQVILESPEKIRFAKWYEKHKFKTIIYEF